jgi:hypothetical protein
MTAKRKKTHSSIKGTFVSLKFRDKFCFQSSSGTFYLILQTFDDLGGVSLFQGNQSPNFIKRPY